MLSDKDFSELLEKYNYSFKVGSVVEGELIAFEGNNLLVDINAKACAVCLSNEILISKNQNIKDLFEIGKKYEFVINSQENEEGIFYLSHRKVALSKNIEILKEKFEKDEIVIGTVHNIVKGGLIVSVMGVKGFIPISQLRNEEEKVGNEIELKILSLNMEQNNFILSSKKIYNDILENARKEIFEKIEVGMVVKGEVVRLTEFGAFVDIGGVDGLLPLSQISWKWIDKPTDILEMNQKIDVEIIGIEKDKQRVSLSLKSLEENPWLKAQDIVKEKEVMKGVVTRIKQFGAFIEVYPLVEGLLNKTQMQQYLNKYQKELKEHDEIEVLIRKFDVDGQKINLEIV